MSVYMTPVRPDELYHYGVLGMHWGIRRYQPYPDGTKKGKEVGDARRSKRRKKLGKAVAVAAGTAAAVGAGIAVSKASKKISKEQKDALFEQNIKTGKGKADESPVEKMTKETHKSFEQGSKSLRDISKMSKQTKAAAQRREIDAKVKKMSDDDLRKVINRLNLEKQYKNLTVEDIETGWDKAADILDVVGGITGIAASAAVIGATIHKLKVV